jgi:hypothetical protein
VPRRRGEKKRMREEDSHREPHPPANRKLVLYFPSPAMGKVLASKPASSPAVNGLKLRAVRAGSQIGSESQPVITTLVERFMAKWLNSHKGTKTLTGVFATFYAIGLRGVNRVDSQLNALPCCTP